MCVTSKGWRADTLNSFWVPFVHHNQIVGTNSNGFAWHPCGPAQLQAHISVAGCSHATVGGTPDADKGWVGSQPTNGSYMDACVPGNVQSVSGLLSKPLSWGEPGELRVVADQLWLQQPQKKTKQHQLSMIGE